LLVGILPGVTIGQGAVFDAGAGVTETFAGSEHTSDYNILNKKVQIPG
jgi:acetyltransferase-like isoleucine patch superfamily enzyme